MREIAIILALAFIVLTYVMEKAWGEQFSCVTAGNTTTCSDGTTVHNIEGVIMVDPGRNKRDHRSDPNPKRKSKSTTCIKAGNTIQCF